jgi:hypothetical protein
MPRAFHLLASSVSLLLLAGLVCYAAWDPAGFARQLANDAAPGGAGAIEHLTVMVLIPGIVCGLYAFWRFRERLPHPILGYWVLACTLACLYFAGEEASWGQWYFRWDTPEFLARLNAQGETNLHNMSSWLNQKPRALVELFIVVVGVLVPLWGVVGGQKPLIGRGVPWAWAGWVSAPTTLLPAGLPFVAIRMARWVPHPVGKTLGAYELRECVIAWFLMWYLLSYAVRLRRMPGVGDAHPRAQDKA